MKDVLIEARLCLSLARTMIFPAGVRYQRLLSQTASDLAALGKTMCTTTLDEVDASRADDVRRAVAAIQPKAVWTTPGELAQEVHAWTRDASPRAVRAGVDHVHDTSMHHLSSMQLELPLRVSRNGLDAFLRALPAEVIRVKGVAVLSDPPVRAVLFQRVDAQTPPQYMDLGDATDIAPTAILIGVGLDESVMINLARRTLA